MKKYLLTEFASAAMLSVAQGGTTATYENNLVLIFNPPNAPPMGG